MNYSEQLKSPMWQKKRLEILNRDAFTCVCCSSKDNQLHVHHHYYDKTKLIHEYDDDCYVTLCSNCHDKLHKYMKFDWVKEDALYLVMIEKGFSQTDALMFLFRLHKFIKTKEIESIKKLYSFLEIK